jgi:hypothetical protein
VDSPYFKHSTIQGSPISKWGCNMSIEVGGCTISVEGKGLGRASSSEEGEDDKGEVGFNGGRWWHKG